MEIKKVVQVYHTEVQKWSYRKTTRPRWLFGSLFAELSGSVVLYYGSICGIDLIGDS